jgi:hypothetical protein
MPDVMIALHVLATADIFLLVSMPLLEHDTVEPTPSTGRKLALLAFLVAHATYAAYFGLKALDGKLEIVEPRTVDVSTEAVIFFFGNLALVQLGWLCQCYQVWRMFQNGRLETLEPRQAGFAIAGRRFAFAF